MRASQDGSHTSNIEEEPLTDAGVEIVPGEASESEGYVDVSTRDEEFEDDFIANCSFWHAICEEVGFPS